MRKIKKETILLLTASMLLLAHVLGLLQLILGLVLLFLLPGYALTSALFPKEDIRLLERIALSIGLSISTSIISVFAANYFLKIPITPETVAAEIIALTGVFSAISFLRRRTDDNSVRSGEGILPAVIVLLILTLTFHLTYSVHQDYPYPYHTDEWQHIADSVQIIEEESITLTNPYYQDKPPRSDLEIGFHVFLAEFFLLTGRDPVLFYKFLPAVFACISSFMLFVFIYKITGNFFAGVYSMLFFAGLKSNIFVLGPWFFVPLTMCFPLFYLVFYSLSEGLRRGSLSLLLSATTALLAMSLIHPLTASFAYMSTALYLVFVILYSLVIAVLYGILGRKSFRKELDLILKSPIQSIAGIVLLFSVPFLSFLYFLRFLWRESLVETLKYFVTDFMVFGQTVMVNELYEPLFLLELYGCIGFSLAAVGVLYVFMKRRGLILVAGVVVAFSLMLLYQMQGFTVLLFYERAVYCALLCLTPLSGIGLYALIDLIRGILRNKKRVSSVVTLSLIFFVFLNVFSDYYFYEDKIYMMIDEDDYLAIKWLGENRGEHNLVLARPRISDAVYPVSKNYVLAVTPHGTSSNQRLLDTRKFLMSDCEVRQSVVEKYQVDYVLVRFRIKCDFLREIYHQGEDYIYEVSL